MTDIVGDKPADPDVPNLEEPEDDVYLEDEDDDDEDDDLDDEEDEPDDSDI